MDHPPPPIGITCDIVDGRHAAHAAYAKLVADCGGVPVLLPCVPDRVPEYISICRGFILTGGDDPIMEHWGISTHPKAKKIDPQRQAFELALLDALGERPNVPVLGVCLGMQLMGLHAGGTLDQHLPDSLPSASSHWGRVSHRVSGRLGDGEVLSHHRQAIVEPGRMCVIATAPDGVIEAIASPEDERRFYMGVQWHPERTYNEALGRGLIKQLVDACAAPNRGDGDATNDVSSPV